MTAAFHYVKPTVENTALVLLEGLTTNRTWRVCACKIQARYLTLYRRRRVFR